MTSVGLDVGTGFVKCVSDGTTARFPSLYSCRLASPWEEKKGLIEAVGDDAVRLSQKPDAVVTRPVMQGRPVNERGFAVLVKKALELVLQKKGPVASHAARDLHIVVGLPYDAREQRNPIKRLVMRVASPALCHVVPQAMGTLVDEGLEDAIIVSIGQGTTEIVAFQGLKPVKGVSSHHAVGDISSRLGRSKTAYVDDEIFHDIKSHKVVRMLADSILDDLNATRQDLRALPVVLSGGGILIPSLQEEMVSRISCNFTIPHDPVMSNASGLYKSALKGC